MKLYWLKRLVLKWLINDQDFYLIMASLRGPDVKKYSLSHLQAEIIKTQSTARIRYKVGLHDDRLGALIDNGEPLIIYDMTNIVVKGEEESLWYHFDGHIKSAIASLRKVGYR